MADYDKRYDQKGYYWGVSPSHVCFDILKTMPPTRHIRVMDVGCGEGRNAVFFALNGYDVTAFDLSHVGVEKTRELAKKAAVEIEVFESDINTFRFTESFDIIFSTGALHYVKPDLRGEILANYKEFTTPGGLNCLHTFVAKPFVPGPPDDEPTLVPWTSGELMGHYHDWLIRYTVEAIVDCDSGGQPHQHAFNRIIAEKPRE